MSKSKFGNITYESEREKTIRKQLLEHFKQCPIPDDEILSNLGLFLNSKNLIAWVKPIGADLDAKWETQNLTN